MKAPDNSVQLVNSGPEFFNQLKRMIDEAKQEIHLHCYIWEDDEIGISIFQIIQKALDRGIKINILLDGYGSSALMNSSIIEDLTAKGAEVRFFNPIQKGIRFVAGRRLHQKIVLVDRCKVLIGGINISNKYSGKKDIAPWLDYAVLVNGTISEQLSVWMNDIWEKKFIKSIRRKIANIQRRKTIVDKTNWPIKLIVNDKYRGINQISNAYHKAIRNAKSEIIIAASYFLPGMGIRKLLRHAANRGVKISILLSGYSDIPFFKRASNYWYQWMIKNNIQIFEYQTSVVHAKVAVVDSKWATVGSYNLNHLSEYMSIEANVELNDELFADQLRLSIFEKMQSESFQINPSDYIKYKTTLGRIGDWFSYQVIRILMRLFYLLRARAVELKSFGSKK
ncbi:MAG TPA: phospholipase D-like domain-containing protein [Bacteroidia bacterium]|nr:phospholipase D-like domain-containing protein [Bacteroidia bacterium]